MIYLRLERIIKSLCVLVFLSFGSSFASESSDQCPDIKLLQNASPEEVLLSTITPQDTPFLSKDYCLALFGPTFHHLADSFYSIYNTKQRRNVSRNYHRTYKRIEDLNRRFIFVHFFLREMSHKMTLTGLTKDKKRAGVLVRFKGEITNQQHWIWLVLSEELEIPDFMQRLSKVQQGNPQPEDYPAVMTLVEKVMDGNHYLTNNELNALIQQL